MTLYQQKCNLQIHYLSGLYRIERFLYCKDDFTSYQMKHVKSMTVNLNIYLTSLFDPLPPLVCGWCERTHFSMK